MWRGPALAEFSYEPFAQAEISRLEELRLGAAEDRMEAELACGNYAQVAGELEALVARHPFRERLRAQLMLSLYRSGRQAEALEAYRRGREVLAEELGIDPSLELAELEGRILRQDPALLGPPQPSPAPAPVERLIPGPPPTPAPSEVRKTVTVVFCDLAESTALGERLDPEALRGVMSRYFGLAKEAVHRHGGTVEKFIGDAVMAVFGLPVLHEDDALRAVRAAAELKDGLQELSTDLERTWGTPLRVRVGVNTGEVVAGEGEGNQVLVTGDPVNTAARLQQAAGPGEVLMGEATHRLVAGAVRATPVPRLSLKGKREGVGAWRVTALVPGAAPYPRRLDAPLVGRRSELAQLHQALDLDRVAEDRTAYLFTVLGAPGVGKTRLALEFSSSVAGGATVLQGRCLPYGEGITYWPLREVLHQAFGEDLLRAIEGLLEGEELAPVIAERVVGAVGATATSGSVEEIRWAVRRVVEALARRRPVVLVLEDLHWAEPEFLDLVDHLADLVVATPVLMLCLARPELLEDCPAWGGGKRNATTVELEPLGIDDARALLANLSPSGESIPHPERVMAVAEGNPLFLEQLVAAVAEGRAEDREVPLPETIQALLAARLERLGPGERAVLERAAMVGKEFSEPELLELLPEEARQTLTRHLEQLVRKRFLRRASTAGAAYLFRHVLVQEAAYRGIPKRTRAELHERFGDWVQQTAGNRLPELEEIVGYHLEQAYRYRVELEPADERARTLAARGAAHLAAGGRRAMNRGDASAAARQLGRAAALLPSTDPRRIELLPRLGEALYKGGNLREAAEVLDEAIEVAEISGQRRSHSYAIIERARVRVQTDPEGAAQEARDQAEAAVKVFEEVGDERGLARAWRLWSELDNMRCRWDPVREANERALVHARRGRDESEEAAALGLIAHALVHDPTPVPEAITRCEEILRESTSSRMLEANVLGDLGFLFGLQGRADQARHHFARSREIYEQLGPKHLLAVLAMRWGHAELTAGDPVAAEDELRRGKEILEQIGERSWLSTVMTNLASAVYEQGRYKEARRLAETAQELGATDDIATVVEALGVRAKASAREDDHERGAALLRQALRLVDETDMLWLRGVSRMDLAEFHRLTGPRNRGDRGRPAGSRALRAEAGGRPLRACSSIPLRTRSRRLIFQPRRSTGSRRRGQPYRSCGRA